MTESELRWILLVAGLLLLAGIYAWGMRSRRRSAAPEPERSTRIEQPYARPQAPADEPAPWSEPRREPRMEFDDGAPAVDDDLPEIRADDDSAPARHVEMSPRRDAAPDDAPAAVSRRPAVAAEDPGRPSAAPPAEPRRPPQKIVALRVAAPAAAAFGGAALREAIVDQGFEFGRYDIYHRLDDTGRPIVSLASLREPGTFDPETMDSLEYRGVALFAVLPGPIPSQVAFDELVEVARSLAARLGGVLQDDRGASLSVQRIGHLREEVAEFDRSRARAAR
jgi:cell division protein ZipA